MKTTNCSIVIPLVQSPRDLEIRYALRSLEKYVPHRDVFIVGYRPPYLKNIIHIPFFEFENKQHCIRTKVQVACRDERISDPFLFTNDDIFCLSPVERIPYYWQGDLTKPTESGSAPLYGLLTKNGYPVKNFDIHIPIVYEKQKFLDCCSFTSREMIIKSAYCNYHRIEGVETQDLKINGPHSYSEIKKALEGRSWFSVGEAAVNSDLIKVLDELYPEKSKYEI